MDEKAFVVIRGAHVSIAYRKMERAIEVAKSTEGDAVLVQEIHSGDIVWSYYNCEATYKREK